MELNGKGRGIPDFTKALRFYLEALKKCEELGVDPFSNEYTGLELKIAEMYEMLGLTQEAALVYSELASMYLTELTSGKEIPNRGEVVRRDLMVVLLLAILLNADPHANRILLAPHINMANQEIQPRDESLPLSWNRTLLLDFHEGRIPELEQRINNSNEQAFGRFREEYFAARELMTLSCMGEGDFWQAAMFKYHTTLLMMGAGFELGDCLLSLANIGSLAYLESLDFETNLKKHTSKTPNTEGIMPKDPKLAPRVSPGYVSTSSLDMVKNNTDIAPIFLSLSEKYYANVRKSIDGLKGRQRRSTEVELAYIIATYGLGCISLKRGDFDEASTLLHEARLRSQGTDMQDMLETIKVELDKLDKIRASGRPVSDFQAKDLPTISIAFWKIEDPKLAALEKHQLE